MSIEHVVRLLEHRAAHGASIDGRRQAWEEIAEQIYGDGCTYPSVPAETVGLPRGRLFGVSGKFDTDKPLAIWLHGGAFCIGSSVSYAGFASELAARSGVQIYVPDYPLAPEVVFPELFEAVFDIYMSVLKLGFDADNIVLCGDSAGGTLAFYTAQVARNERLQQPRALMVLSPWVDLSGAHARQTHRPERDIFLNLKGLEWITDLMAPGAHLDDPRLSPLNGALSGLADTFVLAGAHELLCVEAQALAQKLIDSGVNVTLRVDAGMPHIYTYFFPVLPAAEASLNDMAAFLASRLS